MRHPFFLKYILSKKLRRKHKSGKYFAKFFALLNNIQPKAHRKYVKYEWSRILFEKFAKFVGLKSSHMCAALAHVADGIKLKYLIERNLNTIATWWNCLSTRTLLDNCSNLTRPFAMWPSSMECSFSVIFFFTLLIHFSFQFQVNSSSKVQVSLLWLNISFPLLFCFCILFWLWKTLLNYKNCKKKD